MATCDNASPAADRATTDDVTTETVVTALAGALADAKETTELGLDRPIATAVDPDGLASVLASSTDCVVEFEYDDLTVAIDQDLAVVVTPTDETVWRTLE